MNYSSCINLSAVDILLPVSFPHILLLVIWHTVINPYIHQNAMVRVMMELGKAKVGHKSL